MKKLITQPLTSQKLSWKILPALLVALCSLFMIPAKAQTWTIGTGTAQWGSTTAPAPPLGYYYPTARTQYIYLASELIAQGATANNIHQIAFNVGSLGNGAPAPNYTISMGLTTVSGLTATGGFQPVTPVYTSTAGYGFNLGWNRITLTTPFFWNGTDNIVVEVCYYTGNSTYNSSPYGPGVLYNTLTNGSIGSYGTSTAGNCGIPYNITGGSASTNRPNIQFIHLLPCNTVAKGLTIPAGTVTNLCPGTSLTIQDTGFTNALSMSYQWLSSPNGTTWTSVGASGTTPIYVTPPISGTVYYKMASLCSNSGLKDSSLPVQVNVVSGFPVYASMPYYEGFETWGNGCAANDKLTSNNWTNIPNTGNSSWRRNDSGASAAWTSPTSGVSAPEFIEGSYSARWHGIYANAGASGAGALSLYVDMSAKPGKKDLSFYYKFGYTSTTPGDFLFVDTSTDGGLTWGQLTQINGMIVSAATWNKVIVYGVPINSATTIFRFRAQQTLTGYGDIYLDAVKIINPCDSKPTAGVVDSVLACNGQTFTLNATGTSSVAGLAYQWQYKPTATALWNNLPGGATPNPTLTMTGPMYYRLIVTCTNTTPNLSDTSAGYYADYAPFYYCYCANYSNYYLSSGYVLVGNVTLKTNPAGVVLLNNGVALPTVGNATTNLAGYEDFRRTITPPVLVRDSNYMLMLTQTQLYTSFLTGMYAVAWLDYNQDGTFNNGAYTYPGWGGTSGERIMYKTVPSQTNPTASQVFQIPTTAPVGLTGLRTTIQYFNGSSINPCGVTAAYGQVEDYLVRIEYKPCNGPAYPGTAIVSDSSVCPGYTVDLIDTTYGKTNTNISRYWQVSTNGGASFAVIPSSYKVDILYNYVLSTATSSKFRLMVICDKTNDTTYSNTVTVTTPSPVHCYPVSTSALGSSDSSDIGSVIIGNRYTPVAGTEGPHLLNPLATKRHTDNTNLSPILELYADSTYRLAIFQTMKGGIHSDALVGVFLDYNNNLNYDVTAPPPPTPFTSELVFLGRTKVDTFLLDTKFTVPDAVIPNVLTGMRVILNNDLSTSASNPARSGKGLFTSGEVEDYIVIFRRAGLNAGTTNLLQNVSMYPNPTGGKFTVLCDAAHSVKHLDVVVTTITGQQLISNSYENVGTHFISSLDLSGKAKGIYFVEIHGDGEKITKKLIVQ